MVQRAVGETARRRSRHAWAVAGESFSRASATVGARGVLRVSVHHARAAARQSPLVDSAGDRSLHAAGRATALIDRDGRGDRLRFSVKAHALTEDRGRIQLAAIWISAQRRYFRAASAISSQRSVEAGGAGIVISKTPSRKFAFACSSMVLAAHVDVAAGPEKGDPHDGDRARASLT
jgi:hypothetical protein